MWDSSFMADMDNFSEINENFDTIKTLLNSIRAQGILNTSDVDKLLSGINTKLEKINTEEDIDLIKIFLSELKQNLDERHGVLISKFGAIESLFSNLLKNSSEMLKTTEVKELFDIVATNLSVFSREVVSQKESLTDISLRLDALRSDDSQKRDIIKNIAVLKSDLERLNNGFDSIVINLNDNFKTLAKTISSIDKTEFLDKFSENLTSIEMSSNTVLSALQVLDKKTEQVETSLANLVKKEDFDATNKKLFELGAQNQEIVAAVTDLTDRYSRIDNLADKIDASVNIIASLKSVLEESDDKNTIAILEELKLLETELTKISSDTRFDEFKQTFESTLGKIEATTKILENNSSSTLDEISNIIGLIKALNIDSGFSNLSSFVANSTQEMKSVVDDSAQKLSILYDANITRVLNDISSNADSLTSKLNQTQASLGVLCEKHFNSVFESITDLKTILAQVDENSVSANNAIFSSITDRLSVFENGLRSSLEAQEKTVNYSSAQLIEQVENIKNLSSVLDYKMDSSVVEMGNVKREFESLKSAVDDVLSLDFVSVVKDLRVDLYAVKQELINSYESSSNDLSDKITDDLYGKYELLISKLDSVIDEFKRTQLMSMSDIKNLLENIASSIVDVLSYVSEKGASTSQDIDTKLTEVINQVKEHNLNYIETVRDVVDVVRVQVESNIKSLEEDYLSTFDTVKKAISENSEDLKKEMKFSYSKLLEIQDAYAELKELLNVNSISTSDKFDGVISSTETIKSEFETKINFVKNSLLDRITEFKKEFICDNAEKASELKFSVESLYGKTSQELSALLNVLKEQLTELRTDSSEMQKSLLTEILENFVALKEQVVILNNKTTDCLSQKVETIIQDFSDVKNILDKVDENVDADMTRQLSIIESNFETLVSQITILSEKSDLTIIDKINEQFVSMSDKVNETVALKLEDYKLKIEQTFDELKAKAISQSEYLQERVVDLNSAMKASWSEQSEENYKQIEAIAETLKSVIDENIKLTAADYVALKNKLNEFAKDIESNNETLTQDLKAQLDDITKYVDSVLEIQTQEVTVKHDEFIDKLGESAAKIKDEILLVKDVATEQLTATNNIKVDVSNLANLVANNHKEITHIEEALTDNILNLKNLAAEISAEELKTIDAYVNNLQEHIEAQKINISSCRDLIIEFLAKELEIISKNIEKETDTVIAELIEQFELLKRTSSDDLINLTTKIEEVVNDQIYTNIEDLKSYLDVKTDNSSLIEKFDNLKLEMTTSVQEVLSNLDKLLDAGVFSSAMSDYRLANEILINSSVDRLNDKIEAFINENITTISDVLSNNNKNIEDRLGLFDKKFVDLVVDKYEELKLLANQNNSLFDKLQLEIANILSSFETSKEELSLKFESLLNAINSSTASTNKEIELLNKSFEGLRSQISNKSFDEAFQASINKQITGLETLISEQLSYVEDINELCANNLPDIAELNTLVKHSLLDSVKEFSNKIDALNISEGLESELRLFKSDIITQFINVFNQVSFVAEQEEIIDFIQDKHDELITVLSHIVTTNEDVDNRIDSLKGEISLINEKITAIISAEGDIDYVYSLQDLESDIANLRLALNEMKENDRGQEFTDLISSTNEIYELVESIKTELPTKKDFDSLAEDIVSISTRTNKLLLASDESYKDLHDNLQDFKLVINDLDERTRNFAQESGMDKIDSKLNALNSMLINGAKTNQVFNQVFEYLAEWVDNASSQINSISNKVETLDDIGQIKTMLADLKAEAADNSESIELIEALGAVFDKQAKKISALETKLDRIIVETTINNKLDMKPMEDTLNKFLVSIDEKMSLQQNRINSLESKLETVLSLINEKDSASLTKKVGGMDRQIAKLNKSIEKIASYVVEK